MACSALVTGNLNKDSQAYLSLIEYALKNKVTNIETLKQWVEDPVNAKLLVASNDLQYKKIAERFSKLKSKNDLQLEALVLAVNDLIQDHEGIQAIKAVESENTQRVFLPKVTKQISSGRFEFDKVPESFYIDKEGNSRMIVTPEDILVQVNSVNVNLTNTEEEPVAARLEPYAELKYNGVFKDKDGVDKRFIVTKNLELSIFDLDKRPTEIHSHKDHKIMFEGKEMPISSLLFYIWSIKKHITQKGVPLVFISYITKAQHSESARTIQESRLIVWNLWTNESYRYDLQIKDMPLRVPVHRVDGGTSLFLIEQTNSNTFYELDLDFSNGAPELHEYDIKHGELIRGASFNPLRRNGEDYFLVTTNNGYSYLAPIRSVNEMELIHFMKTNPKKRVGKRATGKREFSPIFGFNSKQGEGLMLGRSYFDKINAAPAILYPDNQVKRLFSVETECYPYSGVEELSDGRRIVIFDCTDVEEGSVLYFVDMDNEQVLATTHIDHVIRQGVGYIKIQQDKDGNDFIAYMKDDGDIAVIELFTAPDAEDLK